MFDKLIESEPAGAEFKNRKSYFMVSSLVVGILFLAAVVFSIYAAEIGLGSGNFGLTEMLAPVEMAAPEADMPEPRTPPTASQSDSRLPTRQASIARIDESQNAPTEISVVPNSQLARPLGRYTIDRFDTDPVSPGTSGRDVTVPSASAVGLSKPEIVAPPEKLPEPPPIKKEKPRTTPSLGVVNGLATNLPKPTYSAAARSAGAQGKVDVQVLIDESGRVVSARALGGHVMLRAAAESAARRARFTPTLLSNVPVKVTGVITYNFVR